MDLTKRRNAALLITITLLLLALVAVLGANGLLLLRPVEVTMVASGLLAAQAPSSELGRTDFVEPPQSEVRRTPLPHTRVIGLPRPLAPT